MYIIWIVAWVILWGSAIAMYIWGKKNLKDSEGV